MHLLVEPLLKACFSGQMEEHIFENQTKTCELIYSGVSRKGENTQQATFVYCFI